MMSFIKRFFGMEDYVSPIDKFLQQLRTIYPQQSLSQQQDIANSKRISYLRDHVVTSEDKNKMWQDF